MLNNQKNGEDNLSYLGESLMDTHGSERSENLIDRIDIDPCPKPFNVVLA